MTNFMTDIYIVCSQCTTKYILRHSHAFEKYFSKLCIILVALDAKVAIRKKNAITFSL